MNGTREVLLIAKRELRERARSTALLATTAIIVVIVVAMILGPSLLSDTLDRLDVRLVGTGRQVVGEALQATGRQVGMTVRVSSSDLEAAELALDMGQVDVVVDSATTVVWKSLPNEGWATLVTEALTDVAVQRRASEVGLTPAQVEAVVAPVQPTVRYLEPPVAGLQARRTAALVGMVVLFMAISMFGNFVLTGVVEDKAGRVVEVPTSVVPNVRARRERRGWRGNPEGRYSGSWLAASSARAWNTGVSTSCAPRGLQHRFVSDQPMSPWTPPDPATRTFGDAPTPGAGLLTTSALDCEAGSRPLPQRAARKNLDGAIRRRTSCERPSPPHASKHRQSIDREEGQWPRNTPPNGTAGARA